MTCSDITIKNDRVSTYLLAQHLDNKHRAVMALVTRYSHHFRQFGHLTFQMSVGERAQGGGKAERSALLNEDQAYFLLSLSRNTEHVVQLKAKLVKAFAEARRAAALRQTDYLPSYHALHDAIKAAANGSPNERWMHANANKALNRLAGIEAGERQTAGPMTQSLLAVASLLAAKAVQQAQDRREVQPRIKAALEPLATAFGIEQ